MCGSGAPSVYRYRVSVVRPAQRERYIHDSHWCAECLSILSVGRAAGAEREIYTTVTGALSVYRYRVSVVRPVQRERYTRQSLVR